jgi:hypothetical protein
MNLSLKVVLNTSTLLGTAFGLTSLANAAPAGLIQAAPAVQAVEQPAVDAPKIEKTWWHRRWGWHRHWGWHRWHRW